MIHLSATSSSTLPRLMLVLALGFTWLASPCFCFADNSANGQADIHDTDSFSTIVDVGWLFLNGEFILAPYRINANDSAVTINGRLVPAATLQKPMYDDNGDMPMYDDEEPEEERFASKDVVGLTFAVASLHSDARRGWTEHAASHERFSAVELPDSVRAARKLARLLDENYSLILFDHLDWRVLATPSEQCGLCEALLAEDPSPQQAEEFFALAGFEAAQPVWQNWLATFAPSQDARVEMESRLREIQGFATRNASEVSATARLNQFAYPLTLIGMLLGVYAFGHMLKWVGNGLDKPEDPGPESDRYLIVALLLILAMSMVDLAWTTLAGRAGVMREVNPFAAGFINSPVKLALFKVASTSVGCVIFFAWRRRRQVQQATWWMCLVCVLLTFRWVMFNSMMN